MHARTLDIAVCAVLALILAYNIDPAHAGVLGVPKRDQAKYSGPNFTCKDGTTIPSSRVNDDYCDCEDGGDEPGTNACPNGQFYCANKGHQSLLLPSSRVNDGICDCCDGSDEANNPRAQCANTCRDLAQLSQRSVVEQLAAVEEGLKVKEEWIDHARRVKAEREAQRDRLQAELVDKDNALTEAKAKKDAEEALEKAENDRVQEEFNKRKEAADKLKAEQQAASGEGQASPPPSAPTETADVAPATDNSAAAPADEAAVNAEAEGDAGAFPYPAEYQYKPQAATEDKPVADGDAAFPYPAEYAYKPQDDNAAAAATPEPTDTAASTDTQPAADAAAAVSATEEEKPPAQITRDEADKARKLVTSLESERRTVQNKLDEVNKLMSWNLGDYGEYTKLQGECFSIKQNQYEYEFCPFDKATQKEGGSRTSLGTMSKFDPKAMEMVFDGGQKCWNGPNRSLTAKLQCSNKNEVMSVEEPSKCVYSLRFGTPAACDKGHADALRLNLEIGNHEEEDE